VHLWPQLRVRSRRELWLHRHPALMEALVLIGVELAGVFVTGKAISP
jgi:hypothetical protein